MNLELAGPFDSREACCLQPLKRRRKMIRMSASESTSELMNQLACGDHAAASAIYARYARQLFGLADARINQRLRSRVAPEDIVQSVFRTFFRRANDGEFSVDHSGALWRLLVQITLNKVGKQVERHQAGKRDVQLEGALGELQIVDREAGPADVAALTDELDSLMAHLNDSECRILRAALAGEPLPEIATTSDCSLWTVRRILRRIRHLLEERLF